MGAYINPNNESKEEFLKREGKQVIDISKDCPADCLPVVLVDNGFFTAAGICYDENEVRAFTDPSDIRPRKFYFVEKEKLYSVSNLGEYLPRMKP